MSPSRSKERSSCVASALHRVRTLRARSWTSSPTHKVRRIHKVQRSETLSFASRPRQASAPFRSNHTACTRVQHAQRRLLGIPRIRCGFHQTIRNRQVCHRLKVTLRRVISIAKPIDRSFQNKQNTRDRTTLLNKPKSKALLSQKEKTSSAVLEIASLEMPSLDDFEVLG